jgi:hypothetical protein
MKVLFVSPNTERLYMPVLPLGLALVVAASRQAGHEVYSLDLLGGSDAPVAVRRAVREFSPRAIGISVRWSTLNG